jgi:hypothetical protein
MRVVELIDRLKSVNPDLQVAVSVSNFLPDLIDTRVLVNEQGEDAVLALVPEVYEEMG